MIHVDKSVVPNDLVLNYHLMHPGGDSAPGDPNLAYFLDGTYHLHYILRHPWSGMGTPAAGDGESYSFVHVTSTDMLNWSWQPTKLQPAFTGHGMFSGTGFITKEGQAAAIYAGVSEPPHSFITIARDNELSSWGKPYPVLPTGVPEGKSVDLLGDPDLFQSNGFYYAFSDGNNLELCKSSDLVNWSHVGPFLKRQLPDVAQGEDISCANFFPLGEKWMLLCISHFMGCRYYLGKWDVKAEQFVPETHGRMNWRRSHQSLTQPMYRDFFAPESVLTPDGRRVMWSWLATIDPKIELKSVQSLPRELSLHQDGSLRIDPLRELESLRYDPITLNNVILGSSSAVPVGHFAETTGLFHTSQKIIELLGDSYELRISIDRREAERKRFGVQLFSGTGNEGFPVLIMPESSTIRVGETEAPFTLDQLPIEENVDIRIFVDKYLVEVFVNGRQAALCTFMEYREAGNDLNGYVFGHSDQVPSTKIRRIEIWKLKPSNRGFLEALETRVWAPKVN